MDTTLFEKHASKILSLIAQVDEDQYIEKLTIDSPDLTTLDMMIKAFQDSSISIGLTNNYSLVEELWQAFVDAINELNPNIENQTQVGSLVMELYKLRLTPSCTDLFPGPCISNLITLTRQINENDLSPYSQDLILKTISSLQRSLNARRSSKGD